MEKLRGSRPLVSRHRSRYSRPSASRSISPADRSMSAFLVISSTSALVGWVIVWFLPSVRARAPISPHPQGTRLGLSPDMHLTRPGWSGDVPCQSIVEAMRQVGEAVHDAVEGDPLPG